MASMNSPGRETGAVQTLRGQTTRYVYSFGQRAWSEHHENPDDIYIAVMGVTGAGKSTFIANCTGKEVQIGHSLKSCTSRVESYSYNDISGRKVHLIDTPGFDDTTRTDAEILRLIAAWLADSYNKNFRLHGIIYLHRIQDNRMTGSAARNLILFRKLCGDDALKRVHLATTMWEQVKLEKGEQHEKELLETREFWGGMMENGSSCSRYHNGAASAQAIVQAIVRQGRPFVTQLQKELVQDNLPLSETASGQELNAELRVQREKWNKERLDMQEQIRLAKAEGDKGAESLLTTECKIAEEKMERTQKDMESLAMGWRDILKELAKGIAFKVLPHGSVPEDWDTL